MSELRHRDDTLIFEAIAPYFPDLEASGWRLLGEGFGSTVIEHDTGRLLVRIARSTESSRRMETTIPALCWLAPRLTFQVPTPIWQLNPNQDPLLLPGAFAYRKLDGDTLRPERIADGTVESLTAVLVELHRSELQASPRPHLPSPADFHAARRDHYGAIRDILRHRLTRSEFSRIEAWQGQPVPLPNRLAVVHGDFWQENILIDDATGRVRGVLDWEFVAIGDPAQDLVPLRSLGAGIADEIAERYLEAFPEDGDNLPQRLQWWWENRDFDGIYLAHAMDDAEEVTDGIRKLREGPILLR